MFYSLVRYSSDGQAISTNISGQGGGGGGGGEGGVTPSLEILTIACLTFCLLLTDRPILSLPEDKLKVVIICKMHGTGGLEVVVLWAFWPISTICRNCNKK